MTCPVCRGEQQIRVPLYYPVNAETFNEFVTRESWKSYPCPECSTEHKVKYEKVCAAQIESFVDTQFDDNHKFQKYAREKMAYMIGAYLLEKDWIEFEIGKPDPHYLKRELKATVYIVSPKNMVTFLQRVNEQARKISWGMIEEIKKQISNWGSFYQESFITKGNAIRLIHETYHNFKDEMSRNSVLNKENIK